MTRIISNAVVLTPFQKLEDVDVFVEEGRISALLPASSDMKDGAYNAEGSWLVPGFIDLQINGAFGKDFTQEPGCLWEVAAKLPAFGVTSFLPTIITSPLETVGEAQRIFNAGPPAGFVGALPLGLHIEGPYLNPERKGAHQTHFLRVPLLEEIESWTPDQGVRLVTLAPELPGGLDMIHELRKRGVIISAGHSLATVAEAQEAFKAGVAWATHLFNAMTPLSQFEPGLAGAVLDDPSIRFGLIPDGIHVHPTLVSLIWKLSGPARLTIVTDAMAALGMPPGNYTLGKEQMVLVNGESARLEDGTLAGSILKHDQALKKLMHFTGCNLQDALQCLTSTPANLLGLDLEIGQIAPGYRANMVLLSPELNVLKTYIDGVEVTH